MKCLRTRELSDLFARAREGNAEAENALFDILTVRFRLIATRYVGDDAAHDVVQDACQVILARYRTEAFHRSFEAWCHGVLKTTMLNHVQKAKRRAGQELPLPPDLPAAVGNPRHPSLTEALRDCLREMMAKSRPYVRILNLAHQGFRTAEICERLGISRNHYYVSLSRGREMLRACLRRKGVRL